jgi:membrane associated rhomboid family serine protease
MYALWLFGNALEYQWGGKKFLSFYLATGIGAALFYALVLWIQVIHAEAQIDAATLAQMKTLLHEGRGFVSLTPAMQQWYVTMNTPMVGASGAVYGVLLGFGMLYPNSVLHLIFPPVALKAKWVVVGYGAIELILGLVNSGGNIAHFAHIGGMLFGFIMIKYWQRKGKMYY